MTRANLALDNKVYEDFSLLARQRNKTLFAFANESISVICKICSEGGDVADIYPLWRIASLLREFDVAVLPEDFLDELIAKEYSSDREGLLKMFQDLGSGRVSLLKLVSESIQGLAEVAKNAALLLPLKSFSVKEKARDVVEIDIVGAGKRTESAECTAEFLKAVLNGYGYVADKQELGIGTIRMWARRRGSPY